MASLSSRLKEVMARRSSSHKEATARRSSKHKKFMASCSSRNEKFKAMEEVKDRASVVSARAVAHVVPFYLAMVVPATCLHVAALVVLAIHMRIDHLMVAPEVAEVAHPEVASAPEVALAALVAALVAEVADLAEAAVLALKVVLAAASAARKDGEQTNLMKKATDKIVNAINKMV